jgi:hypothetical protein
MLSGVMEHFGFGTRLHPVVYYGYPLKAGHFITSVT